MNHQSENPGYGYQLAKGATSLTEAWNADPRSSQNHFMLGQIVEWLYHDLAGIRIDPSAPGFKRIEINPQPVGTLTSVSASLDTIRGIVGSRWTKSADRFSLTIVVPPNTTATVYVPAASPGRVSVEAPAGAPIAKVLRQQGDRVLYEVAAGTWVFKAPCCAE
jgi:alpha-L-rhamnosidase